MKPRMKFAVVGCGYIGKRHIDILSQHPGCELTAVIDENKERASPFQYPGTSVFSSLKDFLQSDISTDIAVIATPNGSHASMALELLKHQKHVLIEKPMALKRTDAEQLIATAREQNKKIMVVLQNRYAPVSIWLKQLIESKQLGEIFMIELNCFWNRDERYYKKDSWHGTKEMDGGSLFTQFSHFIDTMYWIFGDIRNISSRFANFNHKDLTEFEDAGCIHFELEKGGMGSINFSTAVWDKSFESSLTIIAKNGTVKVSGQYMDKVEYCHVKNYELPAEVKTVETIANNHRKMIDAMIEAVEQDLPTNAEDALHSVDIIERIYTSSH